MFLCGGQQPPELLHVCNWWEKSLKVAFVSFLGAADASVLLSSVHDDRHRISQKMKIAENPAIRLLVRLVAFFFVRVYGINCLGSGPFSNPFLLAHGSWLLKENLCISQRPYVLVCSMAESGYSVLNLSMLSCMDCVI